jgi:cob(I)alamin adenosyltransferase
MSSPNIIIMIHSRRAWARNAERKGQKINEYKVLRGKLMEITTRKN